MVLVRAPQHGSGRKTVSAGECARALLAARVAGFFLLTRSGPWRLSTIAQTCQCRHRTQSPSRARPDMRCSVEGNGGRGQGVSRMHLIILFPSPLVVRACPCVFSHQPESVGNARWALDSEVHPRLCAGSVAAAQQRLSAHGGRRAKANVKSCGGMRARESARGCLRAKILCGRRKDFSPRHIEARACQVKAT